jgi:hypothetical protein
MTKYTFELDSMYCNVEMHEEDEHAQIYVNNALVAEYTFSGAGVLKINHADPKALIDTLVAILYEKGGSINL